MRIKDVVTLRNDKTTDISKPYIALENIVSWDAKFIESEAETEGTNSVFKKGDILFGKLRPYLAKGFCPSYDGICSTEFFVMRPKKDVNQKYLLFYFLSDPIIDFIKNQVTGVKMPRTKWSDFGNIAINMPSPKEQQRIVDYLDEKLAKIDERIAVLEKQKNAYARLKKSVIHQAVTRGLNPDVPLKDSGIEWIGMIPEHWEVKRIKDVVSDIFMGVSPVYEYDNDNQNYVFGQRNNQEYGIDFEGIKYAKDDFFKSRSLKEFLVYGDVLLNTLGGGSVGRTGYYDREDKIPVITDGHVMVIRSKKYNTRFMYYYLYSRKERLEMKAIGSTNQAFFNVSDIRDISLPTPSDDEQQTIVSYLDEKCAKIDAAMDNIGKQIDASKRLKRALINEVITGQRAV